MRTAKRTDRELVKSEPLAPAVHSRPPRLAPVRELRNTRTPLDCERLLAQRRPLSDRQVIGRISLASLCPEMREKVIKCLACAGLNPEEYA